MLDHLELEFQTVVSERNYVTHCVLSQNVKTSRILNEEDGPKHLVYRSHLFISPSTIKFGNLGLANPDSLGKGPCCQA